MPGAGDRTPFRKVELTEEQLANLSKTHHGLREMYTRENTERRRVGGHTLRRYLTGAQDRALTAHMVKIREEWRVANNDDVVLVFSQQQMALGKENELHPKLVELAKAAVIPKRGGPFAPGPNP